MAEEKKPAKSGSTAAKKSGKGSASRSTARRKTGAAATAAKKRKPAAPKSGNGRKKKPAESSTSSAARTDAKKATTATASSGAKAGVRLEKQDGYAFIIFNTPGKPVNLLDAATMAALDKILDEVASARDLTAVLFLSEKPGNFIAGADVEAIQDIRDPKIGEAAAKEGHRIFGKIANLNIPSIAVIDGVCIGGGLEMSLACSYRLARASSKTRIGLPEVKIGLIPGWGGCQRLPRLIGIQKALGYILTGKLVDAKRAYRDGVIDRIIPDEYPADYTKTAAIAFARELESPQARERIRKRRGRGSMQKTLLESNPLGRKFLFDQARRRTLKATKGHYPAPIKALEAVEEGFPLGLKEGLAIEARLLGECIVTDVCKRLVHVFFLSEANKKDSGADGFTGEPLAFENIGVLGAGVMGGGIAQIAAYNDLHVRMRDLNLAAIAAGMKQASDVFMQAVKKRKMKPKTARDKLGLITGTTDYTGFEHLDIVIEAIVEDLDIKKKVFAELDTKLPPHAVIASNTSSLPVTEMAAATKRADKIAGLHFFNPVHRMPLVEVIRAEKSSDETIVSLVAFARKLGKTPIVVKDAPGFLVNRILSPYMNEALVLLEEGQMIDHIDKSMERFGMPMGPLTLFDEVGIDVSFKVAKILENAFGTERMHASPIMEKMYELKNFGKKTGKGFYIHKGRDKTVDSSLYAAFGSLRREAVPLPEYLVQERCVLLMINEAARCLEEGIVREARDVDIGMIFGTGFPPFRGGLLRYADSMGLDLVQRNLSQYAEKYGDRFKPAALITKMAEAHESFYRS